MTNDVIILFLKTHLLQHKHFFFSAYLKNLGPMSIYIAEPALKHFFIEYRLYIIYFHENQ
jgi:hypothetical protein